MNRSRSRTVRRGTLAAAGVAVVGITGAWAARPLLPGGAVPPVGWFAAGSHPRDYEMAVDTTVRRDGKSSARLTSIAPAPSGFGTLMQVVAADAYRGRRIRFAGDLRVRDVTSWASLWTRVDGPCGKPRSFDNAQGRAARGTAEWQPFAVVLDVPNDAQGVFFGILLTGGGSVWASGLRLEVVPTSVPVTAAVSSTERCGPPAPVNLEFTAGTP